jgi:hypothetical protein
VIALGETAVGVALMIGLFVSIAAFLGAMMNFSYMLPGLAGVNAHLFLPAFALPASWKGQDGSVSIATSCPYWEHLGSRPSPGAAPSSLIADQISPHVVYDPRPLSSGTVPIGPVYRPPTRVVIGSGGEEADM